MKPHDVVFHAKTLSLFMIVRIYDDERAQLVYPQGYVEHPISELSVVEEPAIQKAFEYRYSHLYKEWEDTSSV